MEKKKKRKFANLLFVLILALILIPQTRKPIQILINKGLALFSPSVIDEKDRSQLSDYHWNLISEDGLAFDFNQAKGKVIVINFWATWCPPCIAEMDSLEELYKRYSNDQVVFLFVTSDFFSEVSKFKEKRGYSFPAFRESEPENSIFEVSTIPRTLIIDKSGNIAIDKTGASNWSSESVVNLMEKLLLEK